MRALSLLLVLASCGPPIYESDGVLVDLECFDRCSYVLEIDGAAYAPNSDSIPVVRAVAGCGSHRVHLRWRPTGSDAAISCFGMPGVGPGILIYSITRAP